MARGMKTVGGIEIVGGMKIGKGGRVGGWPPELEAMSWPDSPKCTNHNIIVYFASNIFSQHSSKIDH